MNSFTGIRQNCEKILSFWKENPSFQLADTTYGQFDELVRRIDQYTTSISDAENRQIQDRMSRQRLCEEAAGIVTRVRSMARGFYGPDTIQLKQTGHTILSERKSPTRKVGLEMARTTQNAA